MRLMSFKVMQNDFSKNEVTLWMYGPEERYYCEITLAIWPFDNQGLGSVLSMKQFLRCLTKTKA